MPRTRKRSIPFAVRRAVALAAGCGPGQEVISWCEYCGAEGRIRWWRLSSGKPSGWVSFSGLELDHRIPEARGGRTDSANIVLACRRCNRSKGAGTPTEWRLAVEGRA